MRLTLSLLTVAFVVALSQTASAQDFSTVEVFGGFSHNRVDTGLADADLDDDPGFDDDDFDDIFDQREGFNGFNVSVTGNFSRYVGAKFDVSGHYRSDDIFVGPFADRVDSSLYNFLGGVQIKDNSTSNGRLRPFGHLLVGAAVAKTEFESLEQLGFDDDFNETGLAGAIGGGLDINASERIDIRVFQIDYNPTRLFDSWQHNFRIGIGIVFH